MTSHLGEAGVVASLIAPLAEFFDRQADALATDGAALRAVPPGVLDGAKQRHRFAALLHRAAAAIFNRRHRARPLPHRRAGYTQAE